MTQTEATRSTPLLERLSAKLVPELRSYLKLHRGQVEQLICNPEEPASKAGDSYSRAIDGLLSSLFYAAQAQMQSEGAWAPVCIAAVGSYGRKTASLHSDLDIRMLCKKGAKQLDKISETLLMPLWDAGLIIGHQVASEDELLELARTDLPTATALLDLRPVVGEIALSQSLLIRAFEGIFGPVTIRDFLERLETSAIERQERFGSSVFLLEPDVKNGAGGLRDLDIAHWAARARWRVGHMSELVRMGVLVPREYDDLRQSAELLWRIRHHLHLMAGRRADRLGFEQQEALTDRLGYGKGKRAVEKLMSEYYKSARVIERTRQHLVLKAMPPPKRKPREQQIGNGLKLTNDMVSLVDPDSIYSDPALVLRLYREAVRRELLVYEFARQVVARATISQEFCERLRATPEAAKLFVELVQTVQKTRFRHDSVLRELHEVGLLLAMVPEFEPVVGRVHHDIYHVYTVDVHSIAAVDRLRALCRGDLVAQFPLASRLAAEIARPTVVFLATLLHDIGKDLGGKDHSERGAEMCHTILGRLQVSLPEIEEVSQLVRQHLRMYLVATRRDIDDPKTLNEFCGFVHGREGLRELYLLTVSDVSTTSPTAMTTWKARMLDDLYVAADRWFSEGGVKQRAETEPLRKALTQAASKAGVHREFTESFIKSMPERYLFANSLERATQELKLAHAAASDVAKVSVVSVNEPYVELAVIADDAPGLLAKICATFSSARFKVVNAQIYSWTSPGGEQRVLDLFWVRAGNESAQVERAIPRVENDLRRLLAGEIQAQELVQGRGKEMHWNQRPGPRVEARVNVDNRSATQHTIVEVVTKDRRDLLYHLSSTIAGCGLNIYLAKINTEGDRVADVFYVSKPDGSRIADPVEIGELQGRLASVIVDLEGAQPPDETASDDDSL